MIRSLGRIAGKICVKARLAIERTSTDHYYLIDDVISSINTFLKRSDAVYTCGQARIFEILDERIKNKFCMKFIQLDKTSTVNEIQDDKNFILRISLRGEEMDFLKRIESRLSNTHVIIVSTTVFHLNRHMRNYFALFYYLKSQGFTDFRFLGGAQESYWQPVQEYAGLTLIAGKHG